MGYTHYWRQKQDFSQAGWASICESAQKLIAALPIKVAVEFDDPTGEPVVDGQEIRFNGIGDAGHETFLLTRFRRDRQPYEDAAEFKADGAFSFCKTAQKPYDLLVCAVLIVAGNVAPDVLSISSDGDGQDWSPALSFVKQTIDAEMQLPESLRQSLAA